MQKRLLMNRNHGYPTSAMDMSPVTYSTWMRRGHFLSQVVRQHTVRRTLRLPVENELRIESHWPYVQA